MSRRTNIKCPDCGALMVLRNSRHGPFYGCSSYPECTATHGAHPDGSPLGIPGTREVKDARIAAHAAFDAFWRGAGMTRKQGYAWLQDRLGMIPDACHIGRFDAATCEQVIEAVKEAQT
jgi:ssDNA-binding Zn-finger/Zn-ribbon topoisomerase 1